MIGVIKHERIIRMGKVVKKYVEISLVIRIIIGLIIGSLLGIFLPQASAVAILGKVFVGALKAIAPLLVFVLKKILAI